MNKKFVSVLLCFIFVFSSFACFGSTVQSKTLKPSSVVALCGDGRRFADEVVACDHSTNPGGRFVSLFKLDLSEYLPYIYSAQSITFSVKSHNYTGQSGAGVTFSFVDDSIENYDPSSINYSKATLSGFLGGFESFYTIDSHEKNTTYTSSDIKGKLISALAGGSNNMVTVRCRGTNNNRVDFVKDSIEFKINYPSGNINSVYLNKVKDEFKIESLDGVSSGEVSENIKLPHFFRGAEVFWLSDNDAIKIDLDDNRKAVVSRPVGSDANVILKAAFADKNLSDFVFKEFALTVPGKRAIDAAAESFDAGLIFSGSDSKNSVTKNLNLPKTYEGFDVSWTSDDELSIKAENGRILRPIDADKSVTLTATLSSDGDTKTLEPIIVTLKKETRDIEALSSGTMAVVKFNASAQADQDDSILYSRFGSYSAGGVLYNRYLSYIMFDISDVKDAIVNSAGSVHISLTGQRWYSSETRSDNECYNLYIINETNWDNTLTYAQANQNGMVDYCTTATYNDPNAVYCSPRGQMTWNQKYTTTDILPEIKAYIANNPTAEKISFMLLIPNNEAMVRFYGTSGTDTQRPNLEIRYNN